MNLVPEEIETYCESHSSPESEVLKALVKETYENAKLPQMQVGHLEGAFLKILVRLTRAQRVLEIGTFTGYSALAMAEGLPENGKVITCDIDPVNTEIARKHWSLSPNGKKIELKLGPALQTLETIEGPFDLAFIDADKENYLKYWNKILPKMNSGGLLIADNVLWSGRVLNPKEPTDHKIAEFNKQVHSDPRVELLMLPVRDGMTLAWKR